MHDRIEANGKWIIAHSGDIEILDKNKKSLAHTPLPLPNQLQTQRQSFTAGIYDIELPITISQNNDILENFSNTKNLFLEPQLSGTIIKNFSKEMPPVFSKNDISISFQNFSDLKVNRTWILITKFDHLIESRKFSDLQKVGILHFANENVEINLNLFNISEPGIYSMRIVQDMRQLIENPLNFYFLPLNFTHPNPEKLYSPNDYPSVKIENIHKGQIIIRESKAKVIENDQGVHVEWRNLVNPVCKLYLRFDQAEIPLFWDINRVFAWVEGLGDDRILRQNDIKNAQLHIRGSKNCNYSLQIGNDIRSEQLNAKGNFDDLIRKTPIVDMIKQQEKSKGEINIDICNKKWLIAYYLKHPTVRLKQKFYNSNEKNLTVSFEINKFYEGDYKVQIQNYEDSNSAPITIYEGKHLRQSIEFFQEIQNGSYEILVFNYDEKIELIDNGSLIIENQVYNPSFSEFDLTLVENSKDYSVNIIKNPNLLFKRLCTNGKKLKSELKNLEKVWAPLDQINIINDFNKWQHFPENQHFQGPRLLPSWAVIDHPLTFMTTDHSRKLYVFPEKVAYKGKAGKGYMALKINGIKTNTYVNWNLIGETSYLLRCRIMIPQSDNYKCISELDEADLWPAYQCQYCGEIIGSREGGFPKFNVEVWVKHRHGRTINKDKLFKDIVFEKGHHLYVRQNSYNQERLQHFHKPSEIYNEIIYKNFQNNHELLKTKELSRPLNLFSDADYCKAASELFHNFETFGSKQNFLSWLNNLQKETLFEKFEKFINQTKKTIPAFSASLRLITNVSFNNHLLNNVDRKVILLSLILRLKANNQFLYNEFIEKFNINESDLIYETHNSASYCPKLLEWAITWAELLYIHAIS